MYACYHNCTVCLLTPLKLPILAFIKFEYEMPAYRTHYNHWTNPDELIDLRFNLIKVFIH